MGANISRKFKFELYTTATKPLTLKAQFLDILEHRAVPRKQNQNVKHGHPQGMPDIRLRLDLVEWVVTGVYFSRLDESLIA